MFWVLKTIILCVCKILVVKTNLKFSILNKIRIANNHEKLQIIHHHQQIFLSLNVNLFLKSFDVFFFQSELSYKLLLSARKPSCHSCKIYYLSSSNTTSSPTFYSVIIDVILTLILCYFYPSSSPYLSS
jgi:hypothetical protein